jgi:hypothetical protein
VAGFPSSFWHVSERRWSVATGEVSTEYFPMTPFWRLSVVTFLYESCLPGALFRSLPTSNFLHSLSITSILGHIHGAVNVCKKITNCTV